MKVGKTIEAIKFMIFAIAAIFESRNRWIFVFYDIFYCISWTSENNIKDLYETRIQI